MIALETTVEQATLPPPSKARRWTRRYGLASLGAAIILLWLFGTLIGGIAAFARGKVEELIMRVTDLVLCFPPIILALAIAAALGIGTTNTIIAMLVVWWPKFSRLARGLVIVQRSQEYVEAALVGTSSPTRSVHWSCW